MAIRKLTQAETEALLFAMADNRDCANSCRCPFCREFWMGVESGKHDAAIEFQQALDNVKRSIGK
jgi:hypothetical protein